jgi:hypothetical protein
MVAKGTKRSVAGLETEQGKMLESDNGSAVGVNVRRGWRARGAGARVLMGVIKC